MVGAADGLATLPALLGALMLGQVVIEAGEAAEATATHGALQLGFIIITEHGWFFSLELGYRHGKSMRNPLFNAAAGLLGQRVEGNFRHRVMLAVVGQERQLVVKGHGCNKRVGEA